MSTIREQAEKWAVQAGRTLMEEYGRKLTIISDPEKKNFSTSLDVQIENTIHQQISETFPDHGFLGEEEEATHFVSSEEFTWVVDPMDGTLNFYFGAPFFAVAIGVLRDRQPHIGVIYDPANQELYSAERGQGPAIITKMQTGESRKLQASQEQALGDAIIMTHITTNTVHQEAIMESGIIPRVARNVRNIRMLGASQLSLAFVARGRFHAFFNTYIKPWDVVAGHVIAESAGAVVTTLRGTPWTLGADSLVAACTPTVHRSLLDILQSQG